MAITCKERPESQSGEAGKSATRIYVVVGTADYIEALTSLNSTAPTTFVGLVRQVRKIEPEYIDVNRPAKCRWKGTVSYGVYERQLPKQVGDVQ